VIANGQIYTWISACVRISALSAWRRFTNAIFLICLFLLQGLSVHAQEPEPLQPVPSVDLARYAGTWHEIALYPNYFQRMCVAGTQANYKALQENVIEVRNRCLNDKKEEVSVLGQARVQASSNNAKLRVRFAPDWLAWLPFVWAPYWVIQLADDYRYTVVSEPSRDYLWILSRTPTLPEQDLKTIQARLKEQGFDVTKLKFTPQP
jgi:apolipoprotein D and lipocalin family protein